MNDLIETLLEQPCWVIDLLPARVPAEGAGRFFPVEEWYLDASRAGDLRRRFADVLLKLGCYHDLTVVRDGDDAGVRNPAPADLVAWVMADQGTVNVVVDDGAALVAVQSQVTGMALYGPSPELLDLVRALAGASGLFVWDASTGS